MFSMDIKGLTIIDYSDDLKDYIRELNYEWLQKYFYLEKNDIVTLSNPKQEIIDNGGFIFYVKLYNDVVGTASLLKKSNSVFELGKMAVNENSQGLGIGKKVLEHCISFAKQNGIKTLILYSNTKLEAAIYLYKKYGFNEIELESGLYERANIKMQLKI